MTDNEHLNNQIAKLENKFHNKQMEFEKKSKEMEYLEDNFEKCKRENIRLGTMNRDAEVTNGENLGKLKQYEKLNKNLNRMNNGLTNDRDRVTREKKEAEHEKTITK